MQARLEMSTEPRLLSSMIRHLIPAMFSVLIGSAASAQDASKMASRANTPEDCARIPADSGTFGLYFNPQGRAQSFYRSECYFRLALEKDDSDLCAKVREKRTLFGGDGSYFSAGSCRLIIKQRREQRAKVEPDPAAAYRLRTVVADMAGSGARFVFQLSKTGLPGTYRVRVAYEYARQDGNETFGALNPSGPSFEYIDTLESTEMQVQGWVVDLGAKDANIVYDVEPAHLKSILAAQASGAVVSMTATLALVRPADRRLREVDSWDRKFSQSIAFKLPDRGARLTIERP